MPPRKRMAGGSSRPSSSSQGGRAFSSHIAERNWSSYARRKVESGRFVVAHDFSEYNLHSRFEAIHWGQILKFSGIVYEELVRLFYCNLKQTEDKSGFTTLVKGHRLLINCDKLAQDLSIPNEGSNLFLYPATWSDLDHIDEDISVDIILATICTPNVERTETGFKARFLHPNFKIFNLILTFNVFPRGGHRDDVYPIQAFVLYALAIGYPINLTYIILHYMMDTGTRKGNLPYGLLLTKLFTANNIDLTSEASVKSSTPISSTTSRLMKLGDDGDDDVAAEMGLDSGHEDSDDDAPAAPQAPFRDPMDQPLSRREFAAFQHSIYARMDSQDSLLRFLASQFPPNPPE